MLTNKHLQSSGIPSESILLLPPEVLAVSWRRFASGLDQAPLPSMCLMFNSCHQPLSWMWPTLHSRCDSLLIIFMDILPQTILSSICLEIDKWPWFPKASHLAQEELSDHTALNSGELHLNVWLEDRAAVLILTSQTQKVFVEQMNSRVFESLQWAELCGRPLECRKIR